MALSPSIADKYEVLAKLSEGGMGAIYKVRHRLLDEVRVIKVVLRHAGPAAELRDRFLGEARMASRLIHPNLARILDFMVDEQEQQLLVMEHIDGPTLQEVLSRSGAPPPGLALEIARQALDALGVLHRCGFVHRDVAPDNLMLTRDFSRDSAGGPLVKLIDFGIAKALGGEGAGARNPALTQAGMFLGKPRYASPEQLTGEPVDARSDLYSFGIVLYELLTERCPFEGHSVRELIAAHLQAEPLSFAVSDPEGRVPAGLRAVVLRLLAKHPEERFADAAELAAALAPFAAPWPHEALEEILMPPAAWSPAAVPPEIPPEVSQETRRSAEPVAPPSLTALRRRSRPGARLNPASVALGIAAVILLGLLMLWAVRARSRDTAAATTPPTAQPSATPSPVVPPSGDLPPQPLDQPLPVYPEKALAFGLPVRVTVDLTVDDHGRVVKAAAPFMDAEQPVPSHLFRAFRSTALKAARALRFQPATRDGKPVKENARLIIEVKP